MSKASKKKTGRPTKLTSALQEKICEYLERGLYEEEAARLAGIHPRTLYVWKKRGEEDGDGIYWEFLQALKGAESLVEQELIGNVRGAAKSGKWQAAAWILERRWPKRWGKLADPSQGRPTYKPPVDEMEALRFTIFEDDEEARRLREEMERLEKDTEWDQ